MSFILRGSAIIALVFLASCGKEPTETQKAQLEPLLIGCLMAVNPTHLDDDNMFSALARLGSLSEVTNKKWSMNSDETTVTARFRSDTTAFECDFMRDKETGWEIKKVRRNGEEVYDKSAAAAKRAEFEAEKEKQKEEELLAEISQWREKDHKSGTYKFYSKYPLGWNRGMESSPELRIGCGPAYPRFQLIGRSGSNFNVEFQFKNSQGKVTKTLIDLTSSGNAGEVYEYELRMEKGVRLTERSNAEAIKILKASSSVEVDGVTFTMDDLSRIPCI
jgi:hypothetical protein